MAGAVGGGCLGFPRDGRPGRGAEIHLILPTHTLFFPDPSNLSGDICPQRDGMHAS